MSELKDMNIWDSSRVLYGYICSSDRDGYLPNIDGWQNSSTKICYQRFYAAMRAYGKNPECFYRENATLVYPSCNLISEKCSKEKMEQFRGLVKEHIKRNRDFFTEVFDAPCYIDCDLFVVFKILMKYRKSLQTALDTWNSVLECNHVVASIYQMTRELNHEYLLPLCNIVDRMLILLMGNDYDRTFTVEELYEFGYPKISDEELFDMKIDEF